MLYSENHDIGLDVLSKNGFHYELTAVLNALEDYDLRSISEQTYEKIVFSLIEDRACKGPHVTYSSLNVFYNTTEKFLSYRLKEFTRKQMKALEQQNMCVQ